MHLHYNIVGFFSVWGPPYNFTMEERRSKISGSILRKDLNRYPPQKRPLRFDVKGGFWGTKKVIFFMLKKGLKM